MYKRLVNVQGSGQIDGSSETEGRMTILFKKTYNKKKRRKEEYFIRKTKTKKQNNNRRNK